MKIFIGCSSSEKINKKYLEEASNLGQELANIDGMELLFGYSDEGSMGRLYKAFINNKKKVSGYNTPIYNTNLKCHNIIICDTIIDRTKALLQSADIWLFLPGGIGTHQELFCAIDLKRTYNLTNKLIIYNDNGFYDNVINTIKMIEKEKFSEDIMKNICVLTNTRDIIKNVKEGIDNER